MILVLWTEPVGFCTYKVKGKHFDTLESEVADNFMAELQDKVSLDSISTIYFEDVDELPF